MARSIENDKRLRGGEHSLGIVFSQLQAAAWVSLNIPRRQTNRLSVLEHKLLSQHFVFPSIFHITFLTYRIPFSFAFYKLCLTRKKEIAKLHSLNSS